MIRNIASHHVQFHLGTHNSQNATFGQANAFFFVDELNVDRQIDAAVAVQTQKIDVDRKVFDNIALDVAANDAHVIMAFDFQVEQGRQKAACAQVFDQHVERDVDRQWISAPAICDTGHHALTACLTGGPLACPRALRDNKIWNLASHCNSPRLVRTPPRV